MSKAWLMLALLVAPSGVHADESAAQLVARIQKFYDGTSTLHARFEQTLESGMGGRARKASGEVWLKKPGRMRWDYGKPEKKLMVADGTTLWVYEEEDAQAWKQAMTASTLPTQVSFLVGQGNLANEFDVGLTKVDGVGAPGDPVLKLIPKTATTAYRYLLFVVDAASGQVKETVIYEQQGGTNRIKFSDLTTNNKVDDAKFRFTPPANVKVLTAPK